MSAGLIKKRRVFYIAGFDPRGGGYYHSLYKKNAARQSAVNGLVLDVGPRVRVNEYASRWSITSKDTVTTFDVLVWDDIVRQEWRTGALGHVRDILDFYCWRHMSDIAPPIGRRSIKRLIGGFYPLIYLCFAAFLSVIVFLKISALGSWPWVIGGALCAVALWLGAVKLGRKIAVFWLLKIYGFTARWGQGRARDIEKRITLFADHIMREIREDDAQEILLVGHSVGGIVAVPVAARLAEKGLKRKLSLVTLGQSIPLVSFRKTAQSYRDDLSLVMNDPNIFWVDYTAPADGACFPLMDVTPDGHEKQPVRLNTRFVRLYETATYKRMRLNPYTIHFLYLASSDYAGEYDYFAMTAGAQSLRDRLVAQGVV